MAEYIVQGTTLTAIADAVRAKKGTTEPIALTDLANEIESIQSGGGSASNKLALVVGTQSADNPYDITANDLEGVAELGGYALYRKSGLRSIELPETCTSIGDWALQYCTSLPSIFMPNVRSIGRYALSFCYALTSVDMPNVESIGMYAFYDNSALTSLTIPSTCTSIGGGALYCGTPTNKCTFTFEGSTPPTIEQNTFYGEYHINKIIVPAGCGETYKTATYWSDLADYIEEATE